MSRLIGFGWLLTWCALFWSALWVWVFDRDLWMGLSLMAGAFLWMTIPILAVVLYTRRDELDLLHPSLAWSDEDLEKLLDDEGPPDLYEQGHLP